MSIGSENVHAKHLRYWLSSDEFVIAFICLTCSALELMES